MVPIYRHVITTLVCQFIITNVVIVRVILFYNTWYYPISYVPGIPNDATFVILFIKVDSIPFFINHLVV